MIQYLRDFLGHMCISSDMRGRSGVGSIGPVFRFDNFKVFAIIYLTGQPEGRCRLPVPAKQFYKL